MRVLIAGAGPAGSSLAVQLAEAGWAVAGRRPLRLQRGAHEEAREEQDRAHAGAVDSPCEFKGQGPGLVNVLLAATHSNSFTTSALPRREGVCSGGISGRSQACTVLP